MSAARPPLAVSAWGGTAALPSLDPASLYVLALVQLAQVPAYAVEPSAWFHTDAVPSLYMAVTTQGPTYVGDVLATTPAAARAYLKEHLDEPHKAEIHAVLALLDDALNDLVLHTLFSLPRNFQKVTCPAFAGAASRWPSSLPRRLRAAVRARLESPHLALWGLGGSWEREERAQQARWHTHAGLQEARDPIAQLPRVGFRGNPGLAQDMRESWERSRLAARARQVLRAIQAHVPEQGFVAGCSQPSAADARLYSLLAPLVLETWPVDVLPALLASEFPALVQHTHRMQEYLWHGKRGWAWARDASMTPPASTWWAWPSWPSWPSSRSKAPKDARPLPPTLRWGRMLWIASALIGPVVYLLASGLVVIEFDDEEAEEEEVEVDADEPVEDEDEAHAEADQLDANDIEELAWEDESLEDDDM
ncbi:hypothetical protein MNAN1_003932 [Malassezia nana]|uniref:Mitochondrial outer membrane transport complex Sam37/metaxin N-terminal domain-containing protein n=1 Tax=Malassezia nana TaxID=180528 RepID=A0AAF0EQE6_9BASI|nr:hypothetical protein MNAN1_003932 [Malassezia nana]